MTELCEVKGTVVAGKRQDGYSNPFSDVMWL